MAEKISPSKSFKGWKFSKWFLGNWKTIKEIFKVGFPFLISTLITDQATQQFLITVVGKFILDCGEFYFKKVSLS